MPTSSLIVSRQSARYVLPSLNPRPFRSCRFFSLNPYLVTSLLHQCPKPEVTKSPVVDPLSIQQLTKCFSHNSFVFMTIHFDGGGVCTPPHFSSFSKSQSVRSRTSASARQTGCRLLSDRQLIFGGKTIFQNRGAGDRNSTGMSEPS